MKIQNIKSKGFTIVELLIVIIVIGILAALVLVAYSNVTNQAKVTTIKGDLTQASKQLAIDRERTGGSNFPTSLSTANGGNGITASSGNTFTYTPVPSTNPTSYCLSSVNGATAYYISSSGGGIQTGTCPSAGMLGWWKLNGDATDSSGNGNNGTFVSGTPTTTTGQNGAAGGAYTFNNQYIAVSSIASALNGQTAFSLTGWVRPVNNPSTHNSYFGYRNNSTANFYVLQLANTNTLECRFQNSAGNFFQPAAPTISPGSWQFIAFVYDGTNEQCYVNATMAQAPATGSPANGGEFDIAATTGTNPMTGGSIDDVRLYNRALPASEIQSLITAGAQ